MFSLGADNMDIQRLAKDFAEKEVRPYADEWDRDRVFPRHMYRRMGELGFLGACFPEKYGGSEVGFLNMVLAAEQIAIASPELETAFNMNAMTSPFAILNWGSDAQRETYVPKLISGELIGSFGLTESSGGSDVIRSLRTSAVREGSDWVINGSKMFITLSPVADVCLLFCRTDKDDDGHRALSCFILHYDDSGVDVERIRLAGLGRSLPVGEVTLRDVRIPADRLVGEVGDGFRIAMNALDYGRLAVATKSLGTAQALIDAGLDYARSRQAFGQPIGRFQMIQRQFADMVTEVEAGRLLLYRAAAAHDEGVAATRLSAYAKYLLGEIALRAANSVVEIYGGYALTEEYPIAHYLHVAHLVRTGEGSANILRVAIAEDALAFRSMDRHKVKRKFALKSDR